VKRSVITLVLTAAASVLIGAGTYFGLYALAGASLPLVQQIIVLEVYAILTIALLAACRPVRRPPLALTWTSHRDVWLALVVWLAVVASSSLVYVLLQPLFGTLLDALRQVLAIATDARRLQGEAATVWAIAIFRGCILVPLFEELLFRGWLLQWLSGRMSSAMAVTISAALFAAMHTYPVVMPYAFVFGWSMGWVRRKTGSIVNPWIMHSLNNVLFLGLGLWLL